MGSSPYSKRETGIGTAEAFYCCCVAVFSKISQNEAMMDGPWIEEFRDRFASFYLWREGFDGKLDLILDASPYLRISILKTMVAISRILLDILATHAPESDPLPEMTSLRSLVENTITALDKDGERDDSDTCSSITTDSHEEDGLDELGFYLQLLMTHIPSMEQVYSQILEEERTDHTARSISSVLPGAFNTQKREQLDPLQKSSQSHISTGSTFRSGLESRVHDIWAKDMAEKFHSILSERRKHKFNAGIIPDTGASTGLANSTTKFGNMLLSLSEIPTKYENPELIREALALVPVDRLSSRAQEQREALVTQAEQGQVSPEWGYQDCLIMSLMRWFKNSFFQFVNNPPCPQCFKPTISHGMTDPTTDEITQSATRVELYRCSDAECATWERFPRYEDPQQLLKSRRGRVGEWARCFTMLCRAMGSRARWVWTPEDYVWTEIYSDHQRRWVHADATELAWDKPHLYTDKWGREFSYCLAFSIDGASNVTRRYVRGPAKYSKSRTRIMDEIIWRKTWEIRRLRRKTLSRSKQRELFREDVREERELQSYIVSNLAAAFSQSILRSNIILANRGSGESSPENRIASNEETLRRMGQGH